MPSLRITTENGLPHFIADTTGRVSVYLDNDSLIELSKGPAQRRQRFLAALRAGGTLLFSFTNAAEVGGPLGRSAEALRRFLDAVGAEWVPLEMNPRLVMEREGTRSAGSPAVSQLFLESYLQQRMSDLLGGKNQLLDLSADRFFKLGSVVDWARHTRQRTREQANQLDQTLRDELRKVRLAYDRDPASLDEFLDPIPFSSKRPATFVWSHLLRTLVLEARAFRFKPHDGLDFCHAVVALSYGVIATLDKQWKRRADSLPTPNSLAKVFYRAEIEEFVSFFELLVTSRGSAV